MDNNIVYVILDKDGVLAVLDDKMRVDEFMMTYDKKTMTYIPYQLDVTYPQDKVYVIPSMSDSIPVYVHNNKALILEVQKRLLDINMTYPDSIDYWEFVVGEISDEARRRASDIDVDKLVDMCADEKMGDINIDDIIAKLKELGDIGNVFDDMLSGNVDDMDGTDQDEAAHDASLSSAHDEEAAHDASHDEDATQIQGENLSSYTTQP